MARLRVGIIGCGTVAQIMWLPNLRELDEQFTVTAMCDLSPGLTQAVGDTFGVPHRFQDYRELVARDDVDMVIVLTPGSHAAAAIAAMEAGKQVIVEKPMCFTLREADEMIATAERTGVRLMVSYMKRYDPGYRYGRDAVRAMDDPRYVQINVLHPDPDLYYAHHRLKRFRDVPPETLATLQADDDRLTVEAIGDVSPLMRQIYRDIILGSMCHDTNALRGILGDPDRALFTTIWPDETVHPTVTTVLAYDNGPRVVLTWSYLAELRDYFEELAFIGGAGRVRIQFPSPWLKHFPTPVEVQGMEGGAEWRKRVNVSYAEAFIEEALHFHHCVTTGEQPLTDGRDGRADIALLQQIVAAAAPQGLGGEAGTAIKEAR
ncbi:MAG: Gfo/Idh/MocA family protein [Thermomicrobiales bacterium]